MIEEDYDVMKLALEELRFCMELGIKPISWEFGIEAYLQLLLRLPGDQLQFIGSILNEESLLYGIPLAVNATVNPWTITLIKPITFP